jgi:hypothetical protein
LPQNDCKHRQRTDRVSPPPADHPTVLIASIVESAPKLISATSISRRGISLIYISRTTDVPPTAPVLITGPS